MPQIDWTPEFKRSSTPDFDRLKLKVGERARIVIMEKPEFAWVHTLRAPKIVDGAATKVIKKRKDQTEYADWDYEFVSRPICLGDVTTIDEDGIDPKNCPVCEKAEKSEECSPPERRFAVNIIKYNTKSDGTVISPFGCSSQVWAFTENMFNKLLAIAQEQNGLVGKDLILGPCQPPEHFQRFDIMPGGRNAWELDESVKQVVTQTHDNNKVEDLENACGRKTEAKWLKRDIESISAAWRVANGTQNSSAGSEKAEAASLKGELDSLLAPPAAGEVNPVTQVKLTDETPRESTSGGEPNDFSKLLADMNL